MYRQQNHQRQARPWADSNHRSPVYKTGALTTMLQSHVTEVSSTFTDTAMVKKPKGPMRIKTMQNVSTAKSSKRSEPWADSNHRSPVYKTGALTTMLQSHVTDVSRSTFTDTIMVKNPKEPMRIKSMQNVPRAKNSNITGHWADSNHRSPVFKTRTITTILESRFKERRQK